jgi:hypothetical protein
VVRPAPADDALWCARAALVGVRLDVVDVGNVPGEQDELVRGRGLRAVRLVPLDGGPDSGTRVLTI